VEFWMGHKMSLFVLFLLLSVLSLGGCTRTILRLRGETVSHTDAVGHARVAVHEGSDMDDEFFGGGESSKAVWLLTDNKDANPFRSLTPYGQVNPYNPLATLIPPVMNPENRQEALTVDSLPMSPQFRWQRADLAGAEDVRLHPAAPYGVNEQNPNPSIPASSDLDPSSFLELARTSSQGSPSAPPGATVDTSFKPYRGNAGGNIFNPFYGAGGSGPSFVFPTGIVGTDQYRVRFPASQSNVDPKEVEWSTRNIPSTPPLGVVDSYKVTPNRRYMPLFDRPTSTNGVGAFALLDLSSGDAAVADETAAPETVEARLMNLRGLQRHHRPTRDQLFAMDELDAAEELANEQNDNERQRWTAGASSQWTHGNRQLEPWMRSRLALAISSEFPASHS